MKSTIIDDLNFHRQQTIDKLELEYRDATVELAIAVMLLLLFYWQNSQWVFWVISGITFLVNCIISFWLKREIAKIKNYGIAGDGVFETGVASEKIRRGDLVYQTKDGFWHKVKQERYTVVDIGVKSNE